MQASRLLTRLLPAALVFLSLTNDPCGQGDLIRAVETNLQPATVPAGQKIKPQSLADRMAHHKVPGVAIAYFENGRIVWARGYGYRDSARTQLIDTATLFQAASISKPVAATGALGLVEAGKLDLDEPINRYLHRWQVPDNSFTEQQPVTLRELVTHTAGLTVHGFRGYADGVGEAVPTTEQVLDGVTPANSDPIRVDTTPGAIWRYSGGGYTVMQLAVEEVSGQPFAEYMAQRVLRPAGMVHSTYQQPLPAGRRAEAATGFRGDGQPVAGRWHTYPEQAAAGLWTTPTDLARWAIAIQAAYNGREGGVLRPETARQMLTPHRNNWGLGPSLSGAADSLTFSHGGANEGFRCQLFAFARPGGPGVAIMTNSDNGSRLVSELLVSFDKAYGWGKFRQRNMETAKLRRTQLDRLAGNYDLSNGLRVAVKRDKKSLIAVQTWTGDQITLTPLSETEFFSFEEELPVRFVVSDNGKVESMVVQGNTVLKRVGE